MAIRRFHCKKCNCDFSYDVGEIGWHGLIPKPAKDAICPNCDHVIKSDNLLFQAMMDHANSPMDLLQAIDHLMVAQSWEQRRKVLEKHPELLSEEAESMLESFLQISNSMGNSDEISGNKQLLWLVRRCREIGIKKTFEEDI